jgi:hypothetical protein
MTLAILECADATDFCEHLCTPRFRFASVRLCKVASCYAAPAPPVRSWWLFTRGHNVMEKKGRIQQRLGERARAAFENNIHRVWLKRPTRIS